MLAIRNHSPHRIYYMIGGILVSIGIIVAIGLGVHAMFQEPTDVDATYRSLKASVTPQPSVQAVASPTPTPTPSKTPGTTPAQTKKTTAPTPAQTVTPTPTTSPSPSTPAQTQEQIDPPASGDSVQN